MRFPVDFRFGWRAGPAPRAGLRSGFSADFRRYTRIIGVLAMLALVGLLQACSGMKIIYNQSPKLAYWYLDSHLDFSGAQSLQARDELAKLQAWHRQNELPGYIAALQKLQQKLPADMDADAVCALVTDARNKLTTLTERAEPAAAALAATLSAAQLAHLERHFAKDNARYQDEFLNAATRERRDRRYKRTVSRAEMLYGRLDDAQLAVIGQRMDQSSFDAERSHAETLRRQSDTLQTLQRLIAEPASPDSATAAIRGLLERTWNSPNSADRGYRAQLTQESCQTLAAIHNSTTPAQRGQAIQTLRRYERELTALSSAQ